MNAVPAILTMVFLAIGAVSLALMEIGLHPELERFPCVNPFLRGSILIVSFCEFLRAADLFNGIWHGAPEQVPPLGVVTAVALGGLFAAFLNQMIRMRLPRGVWARFSRKQDSVRKVASGPHGEALAQLAVDGRGGIEVAENPKAGLTRI